MTIKENTAYPFSIGQTRLVEGDRYWLHPDGTLRTEPPPHLEHSVDNGIYTVKALDPPTPGVYKGDPPGSNAVAIRPTRRVMPWRRKGSRS